MSKKNSIRRLRGLRSAAVIMAALAGGALLAACGGSHAPAPGSSPGQPSRQQVNAFAQCMRSHGLTNFYLSSPDSKNPDPGQLAIGLGYGVVYGMDVSSPQYQSASSACGHLLPGGGEPPPVTAAQLRSMDRAAACMRAHGFPGYPDPVVQNGHLVPRPLPSGIDISSPQFQAAVKTCGNPEL